MPSLQNQQESIRLNLKYQYEIDHTDVYGWVRVIKDESSLRVHGVTNQESFTYSGQKEDKLLLDTDKPLIAYYMAQGCLDG